MINLIFLITFIIICSFWILLTIFKQISNSSFFRRNNDPFSLIPTWTLFSPRPIKNSCLLCYRDLLENGKETELVIVNDFIPKWYYLLWYGQRRDIKFIIGIRRQLYKYKKYPSLFIYTDTFLLINNYLSNVNINSEVKIKKRQVIYLKRGGWHFSKRDKVLFVTNIK